MTGTDQADSGNVRAFATLNPCRHEGTDLSAVFRERHDFAPGSTVHLLPDPQRAGKIRRIRQRIKELGPRTVLLFEDETDLLLFPPLRACWARRGESAEVPLCGWNARRVVFGAIAVRTGHRLLLPRRRQRPAPAAPPSEKSAGR